MKAILEFDLPAEELEFKQAVSARDLSASLYGFDQYLRTLVKHGSEADVRAFHPQAARDKLWEILRENGVEGLA